MPRLAFRFALLVALAAFAMPASSADDPKVKDKPKSKSNRLAKESSPYLLQHAHNPVDWYPWGQEAFDKAKKEKKLVFLSIGYSSCHWCHVMERESFSNAGVAKMLNDNFVCIKVDREERPDVDDIYMTALNVSRRMRAAGRCPCSSRRTASRSSAAPTSRPRTRRSARTRCPGSKSVLAKVIELDKRERHGALQAGRPHRQD